jgi:hypothetical protein
MNIASTIAKYGIPRTTVARIARVPLASVSRFCRDRCLVSANYADRITAAVKSITDVLEEIERWRPKFAAEGALLPKPCLHDVEELKILIRQNEARERQITAAEHEANELAAANAARLSNL